MKSLAVPQCPPESSCPSDENRRLLSSATSLVSVASLSSEAKAFSKKLVNLTNSDPVQGFNTKHETNIPHKKKRKQRVKTLGKRKYLILESTYPPRKLASNTKVLQNSSENKENIVPSNDVKSNEMKKVSCPSYMVSKDGQNANEAPSALQTTTTMSFVKGGLPNFWECPKCRHLPFKARGKHSVFYKGGGDAPSSDKYLTIYIHLQFCQEARDKYDPAVALTAEDDSNAYFFASPKTISVPRLNHPRLSMLQQDHTCLLLVDKIVNGCKS